MILKKIALLTALILASASVPAAASLEVSHQARSVAQGEAVLLSVTSNTQLERVSAEVFKKEFLLFPDGSQNLWKGIVAIDLACKPGSYKVKVKGWTGNGNSPAGEEIYTLKVAGKEFAERRLKVAKKYVSPPQAEMERINREAATTKKLFTLNTQEKFWDGDFLKPVTGGITSPFGRKNFVNDQPRSPHSGVDLRGAVGTPVKAPAAGKVILSDDLYFAGNTVMVDHGFGLISYFCHLSKINVKNGDMVARGDLIGLVGSTGRVTGPHLHWTIKLLGLRVDPMSVLALKFNSSLHGQLKGYPHEK
jgi:murein DD-endopeptidase MepM/ murein hydrolase activator NlpD